jgi:hypothetical protein
MSPSSTALRASSAALAILLGSSACGARVDLDDPAGGGGRETTAGSTGVGLADTSGPLEGDDDGDAEPVDADLGLPADLPPIAGPCTTRGWGTDTDDVVGSVLPTHGYWAWDRCCVERPVIYLLEDTPVLDVGGADELPVPRADVTLDADPEITPPLHGEYRGGVSISTGGHPVGGPATIDILEPISPDDAPVLGAPLHAILRFGPALDFGPFTASYCPALEPTACECTR